MYTQVTSTQKSKYSNAYQVTRDITIATLYLLYGARLVPSQDIEGKKNLRACDWFTDKTNTILIGSDKSANITKH